MKVLVTGGTGFLGRSVVKFLSKRGFKVTCITRKGNPFEYSDEVKYVTGFLEDKKSVERHFEGADVCIHLAAETRSTKEKDNYASNVVATENVVELCKSNRIRKIIFTSSVNARFKRLGPYGKTKLIAENLVKDSGLNYVVLVPDLIYGKGDRGLTKTVSMIKKLPIIPVIGDGSSKLQPVYVEDVADAIVTACESNIANKVYYIGGPESFTFNDYIDIIMGRLGSRKIKIHLPFSPLYFAAVLFSKINNFPISPEQCISIASDKSGDISEAGKDLSFRPISFLRGLDMFLGE
jgi:nucleoside-diphosphate-sugar epimerase